jgi:hypothetical protein
MSVKSRVLTGLAALALTATGATIVLTGSPGTSTTAPAGNIRTMASVSVKAQPAKIACYFEVAPSGKVLRAPMLQQLDGDQPNTNYRDNCVFQIGTKGVKEYARVITPTFSEGSYGVGNGVYRIIHENVSLKGAYPLAGQPKAGYKLACQFDHGVLVPARPGLHKPVDTCHLVGLHLPINYQGVGFELSFSGHTSFFGVHGQANPGHLNLAPLASA